MQQNGGRQQNDWDWFSEACPMFLGWKMNLSYSVHQRRFQIHSDAFTYIPHIGSSFSVGKKSLEVNLWSPWCLAAPRISTWSWELKRRPARATSRRPTERSPWFIIQTRAEIQRNSNRSTVPMSYWETDKKERRSTKPTRHPKTNQKKCLPKSSGWSKPKRKGKKTPGRDKHSWRREPRREQRKLPRLGRRHGKLRDLRSALSSRRRASAQASHHAPADPVVSRTTGSAGAWCTKPRAQQCCSKGECKGRGPVVALLLSVRSLRTLRRRAPPEDEMQEPAPAAAAAWPFVTADSLRFFQGPQKTLLRWVQRKRTRFGPSFACWAQSGTLKREARLELRPTVGATDFVAPLIWCLFQIDPKRLIRIQTHVKPTVDKQSLYSLVITFKRWPLNWLINQLSSHLEPGGDRPEPKIRSSQVAKVL